MENLKIDGNNIYSTVTGDLVAVVQEGNLKIQPGKNAMTRKIKEFYESVSAGSGSELCGCDGSCGDNCTCKDKEHENSDLQEEVNTHKLAESNVDNTNKDDVDGFSPAAGTEETADSAFAVEDIPEAQLPEFDVALGVETPAFKAFIRKHKLTREQVVQLVKRLEKTYYGRCF